MAGSLPAAHLLPNLQQTFEKRGVCCRSKSLMSFSGPQISAFSASRSFHVRSLFLFGLFWFKEQEKQTESNPLSSQPRFDPYQLRVIMMSLCSGVNCLRLDIKHNFGVTASRRGSGLIFLYLKNVIYRPLRAQVLEFL